MPRSFAKYNGNSEYHRPKTFVGLVFYPIVYRLGKDNAVIGSIVEDMFAQATQKQFSSLNMVESFLKDYL
jgi:hypothetical protein